MAITTRDQAFNALANNSSRFVLDKAALSNQIANNLCSVWRATGQPGQGAIPGTTPVIPTKSTLGAIDFTNQISPVTSYLLWGLVYSGNSGGAIEFHDRIAHMGGLVLNITTSQTITGLDISASGLNPPAGRLGASDFSDVQWYLEVYSDGGATASNATVNVTYDDDSSGNLNVIAVGGTLRAGRFIPLTPFIPTGSQGKKIKRINSVILSASTGTAGNFGFTCTRQRTGVPMGLAGTPSKITWQDGSSEVPNDSCLMIVVNCGASSSGTIRGQGKIAHG
jgi:hypothetical protein